MFPPTLLKEREVDAAKTWHLCVAFPVLQQLYPAGSRIHQAVFFKLHSHCRSGLV